MHWETLGHYLPYRQYQFQWMPDFVCRFQNGGIKISWWQKQGRLLERTSKEGALGASKHQRCIILSVQIVSYEISTRFEGLLSKLTWLNLNLINIKKNLERLYNVIHGEQDSSGNNSQAESLQEALMSATVNDRACVSMGVGVGWHLQVFLGLTAWHPQILADQLTLF